MGGVKSAMRPMLIQRGAQARKTAADIIAESNIRLDGKTVVVTGANAGIGKETARALASIGAHVIITCRDDAKCRTTKADIEADIAHTPNAGRISAVELELASLNSCRKAASDIKSITKRIDVLILNAGIFIPDRRETADGLEFHIGVNHFGHFLFGNLLVPLVKRAAKRSGEARIVVISSDGHRSGNLKLADLHWKQRSFDSMQAYMDSKLANVLYANELQRRLAGTGVIVNSLHPGVIQSDLGRDSKMVQMTMSMMKRFLKTIEQGAATSVYVAISPDLQGSSGGKYYQNSEENDHEDRAKDQTLAQQLWQESIRVTGFSDDQL